MQEGPQSNGRWTEISSRVTNQVRGFAPTLTTCLKFTNFINFINSTNFINFTNFINTIKWQFSGWESFCFYQLGRLWSSGRLQNPLCNRQLLQVLHHDGNFHVGDNCSMLWWWVYNLDQGATARHILPFCGSRLRGLSSSLPPPLSLLSLSPPPPPPPQS